MADQSLKHTIQKHEIKNKTTEIKQKAKKQEQKTKR